MKNSKYLQAFTRNYGPKPKNTLRKIGLELELPIVQDDGRAVDYATVRKMFLWLEAQGWELKKDKGTGENAKAIKAVSKGKGRFGYDKDVIGTDVGYCTVETSLSPEDDLFALQKHWGIVKDVLTEFFSAEQCHMLGYGVQPITHPAHDLVANEGRYIFFEQDSLNRFIDKKYGRDLDVFATNASNQCHIDIYKEEAVTALNVMNGLAPLLTALTANAPVWRGTVDPEWIDIREVFWDKAWTNRAEQVGMPDTFAGFEDYIERLCRFRPFMVKRDHQFVKVLGCKTFGEFLERGGDNQGLTVHGDKIPLASAPEDLLFHSGFAWWQARLAPAFGTLEVRPCGQQPPNATMSVSALVLGLIENLSEAEKLYNQYSVAEWRELRLDALRHGIRATIQGKSIVPLVQRALDISRAGLQKRGLGEEKFLEVLQQRVDNKTLPADQVKAVFDKDDLGKFFDLVEIR